MDEKESSQLPSPQRLPAEPLAKPKSGADRPVPSERLAPHADEEPVRAAWEALGETKITSLSDSGSDTAEPLPPEPAAGDSTTQLSRGRKKKSVILGDFQLLKKVGQGAMATVYKAHQISFERTVALKLLHKHIAQNPKLVERFYREARAMGQLDHPNIVQGYGVGEIDGYQYFVMEYVSGDSLQNWLARLGKLSVSDAVYIMLTCCRAMEHAHEQGLVHRDLKPDNILITRKGQVKVADLGMVKNADEDITLTQTGHAVGTPWYMPLEQARNAKEVDQRSDIYSLGCTLYCLLTGKPPFTGSSIVEVIQAKERGTFPPARQSNPEVPERLDLIILKMTGKRPEQRYQSCTPVIRDLEGLGLAGTDLSFLKPGRATPQTDPPVSPTQLTPYPVDQEAVTEEIRDEWYLRIRTPNNQYRIRKHTTAEILRLIAADQIPADTKASRQPDAGFRALATIKEFQQVALGWAARSGADRRTSHYQSLYKQMEEKNWEKKDSAPSRPALDATFWHMVKMVALFAGGLAGVLVLLYFLLLLVRAFV